MLAGFDHVAVLTADIDRFVDFYRDVFGAEVFGRITDGGAEIVALRIGPTAELNVFQIEGNTEASRQTPMFGRGRLDHFALRATSLEQFEAGSGLRMAGIPAGHALDPHRHGDRRVRRAGARGRACPRSPTTSATSRCCPG
jgi:catechol 2,3-dioxygenase-like lactoylglutathione lyase family enzyme